MSRLIFVTGTPANLRQGSGTYAGIAALRQALLAQGHEVTLVAPAQASPAAWRRLAFNLHLRGRRFPGAQVIGFDLDGLFLPGADVACLKGVLAEEAQFERGVARARLELLARCEGWRARQARRVLVTSDYAAAAAIAHYGVIPARIQIFPELLDLTAWRAGLDNARREPRAEPTILAVAHLYRRKDVATLLHALARVPAPARLRVAGDGPERRRLQRLAQRLRLDGRVSFLGHIPQADLMSEYRNADVFCHPSRQEGFGIVLLEAMASGLPIVAARAAAIPEVVPEPDCGVLFPPGDATALAAALTRLLAHAPARQAMGRSGRDWAQRYDAPAVARSFLAAISEETEPRA
ncbi:MAG: glycosyltransferase family 4 protein [Terriglobales bacterium]